MTQTGSITKCIGENIRALRLMNTIRQKDIAESVGVPAWRISQLECGSSIPQLWELEQIAGFFGVPVETLQKPDNDWLKNPPFRVRAYPIGSKNVPYRVQPSERRTEEKKALSKDGSAEYNQLVGSRIKELRHQEGVSQSDLARRLSIDQAMLKSIESGITPCNKNLLSEIAKVFDTSPDTLTHIQARSKANSDEVDELRRKLETANRTLETHAEQINKLKGDLDKAEEKLHKAEATICRLRRYEQIVSDIERVINTRLTKEAKE